METSDLRENYEKELVLTNLSLASGRAEELLFNMEIVELPIAYEENDTHQKRRVSIALRDGTTLDISDVNHSDYHIYNVKISIEEGLSVKTTEYRWNILRPDNQSTYTSVHDREVGRWHSAGNSLRPQHISIEGSNELVEILERAIDDQGMSQKEADQDEDKMIRIILASHDLWVEEQLEKGLTGDGLSLVEWLQLQTYLIDDEQVEDRDEAQNALEQALGRVARG